MTMLGSTTRFFYTDLAGIESPGFYGPSYMVPGFRKFRIKPLMLGDLKSARASIRTVRCVISSIWKKKDDIFALDVSIPVNSRAKVHIPKMGSKGFVIMERMKTVWEDGRRAKGISGISAGRETRNEVILDVGSGNYSFLIPPLPLGEG